MRKEITAAIKDYLKEYPKEIRLEKHLTQAKMAELLMMDTRSYSDLEHHKSMMSLVSFTIMLSELDDSQNDIIEDLITIINKIKSTYK